MGLLTRASADAFTIPPAQLEARRARRADEKKHWDDFWQILDLESRGTFFYRTRYHLWRIIDGPVTVFKEYIVDPLHDKYKMPYYHRKLNRAPEIDECHVNDHVSIWEANEQYRYDKSVDTNIQNILRLRRDNCMGYHHNQQIKCGKEIEEYEEAELNFFIKYGELGMETDVRDAYMKQKHRLIWERRNPDVVAYRQQQVDEHKKKLDAGNIDFSFWKTRLLFEDKPHTPGPYTAYLTILPHMQHIQPLSRDWRYYKEAYARNDPHPEGESKTVKVLPHQ